MEIYKAGIIGCGQIAGGYNENCQLGESLTHACSYNQIDQIDLIAACDPDIKKVKAFAKKWNISNVFPSATEMLNNIDLDIVSICSPTEYHLEAFIDISKAKNVKGIFCEKPLSYDLQESYEILNISKNYSVSLNYFRRWNPKLVKLWNDLKEDKYGKLIYIKASYTKGLKVNGSHLIDILYSFLGMPLDVRTYHIYDSENNDPGVDFRLTFSGDIEATFQHIPKVPYVSIDIDFFTEKGKLSMIQRGQKIELFNSTIDQDYNKSFKKLEFVTSEETDWIDCPTRALKELLVVISNGGEISCTPEDGIRVDEICEKIINYQEIKS